jgi:hypothetical protein
MLYHNSLFRNISVRRSLNECFDVSVDASYSKFTMNIFTNLATNIFTNLATNIITTLATYSEANL